MKTSGTGNAALGDGVKVKREYAIAAATAWLCAVHLIYLEASASFTCAACTLGSALIPSTNLLIFEYSERSTPT